jgi:hypothetical protein
MSEPPKEPLATPLPALDTSTARKPVKVTRSAAPSRSHGRQDLPIPQDVQKRIRTWKLASYASLGCAAGLATFMGAPLLVLGIVPVAGWAIGRTLHNRALLALPPPPEVPIQTAEGLDLLNRVNSVQHSLQSMDLNPQIHRDLTRTLDAMPDRIRSLDAAERRCVQALDTVGSASESESEHGDLKKRLAQLSAARGEIRVALDALTLEAARISTDPHLAPGLEEQLLAQARALANTADDLS